MASLNVAMVCLGNICRSPMAAAVLSNKAKKITEVGINVSSSGTSGWHIGEGPHPTSKLVWEKAGYQHHHVASQFTANDYFVNDYILVMDSSNYENVLAHTGKRVKHYGLNNHKEYFAEGTEAFFYRNDFYPFVRAELKEHDPALENLLMKIWEPAK